MYHNIVRYLSIIINIIIKRNSIKTAFLYKYVLIGLVEAHLIDRPTIKCIQNNYFFKQKILTVPLNIYINSILILKYVCNKV